MYRAYYHQQNLAKKTPTGIVGLERVELSTRTRSERG
jgi:hypothetical protein